MLHENKDMKAFFGRKIQGISKSNIPFIWKSNFYRSFITDLNIRKIILYLSLRNFISLVTFHASNIRHESLTC